MTERKSHFKLFQITPELLKMRRDAKAEQWESELKRQTKAVLPQIIGCLWEQTALSLQEEISKQLEQYKVSLNEMNM
jgi:hypothetical protein